MATNKKDLKAYVRYDGTGRVIAGSLILQRFKPKVGNWKQIGAYQCCDPSCLPPVYGVDFVVDNATEVMGGLLLSILTNPFTPNPTLQVAMLNCNLQSLLTETIPGGSNPYEFFIPDAILDEACHIGFRRVCVDNKSAWYID